jgi:hypothetical protein
MHAPRFRGKGHKQVWAVIRHQPDFLCLPDTAELLCFILAFVFEFAALSAEEAPFKRMQV